ncbi:hypothetical protein H2201_001553 [Coniosporium apollinis]|uniref:Uncharacterized protein n=1 Tax=Coniosporium apollinis TaxID=61459 RepID=A0ABQ9P1L7_9PEZI|nr:hypothetical protein H2201_001553 [Coniosporium apollinis]
MSIWHDPAEAARDSFGARNRAAEELRRAKPSSSTSVPAPAPVVASTTPSYGELITLERVEVVLDPETKHALLSALIHQIVADFHDNEAA